MMTVFDQQQEAIRVGDNLIDPETGEILSEHDVGIDALVLQLKDGQEQEKAWGAHNALLKLAIGKKLDDANVMAAETPYGVACWRMQRRRSASAANIPDMAERFGLDDAAQAALYACARDLDPRKLDGLRGWDELAGALDALIEEKLVSYVLLQPLRRTAPRLDRETVGGE